MSMDVYGKNPRNNVWWWHPLWNFACDVTGINEDMRRIGSFNDGAGLNEIGALNMAASLQMAIASGRVKEHATHVECFSDS
jgi:hypothetical protein